MGEVSENAGRYNVGNSGTMERNEIHTAAAGTRGLFGLSTISGNELANSHLKNKVSCYTDV